MHCPAKAGVVLTAPIPARLAAALTSIVLAFRPVPHYSDSQIGDQEWGGHPCCNYTKGVGPAKRWPEDTY